MKSALIFVYNADSGFFNSLLDSTHKILSPHTYQCNLCAITHSATGMNSEWREFIEEFDVPLEFLHRNELKKEYGISDVPLPAIFRKRGEKPEILFDADTINDCEDIDDLKKLIVSAISD